ncbi:MAG: DoxX family membrane protein [Proteobacteria bacterium]|nr:DoxX family membrane protein [Pseudomonadota bacterium]MBU1611134.1 DoxX family membrane protein [Pseudomonadota bacterium]
MSFNTFIRTALGLVFVIAGYVKVQDPQAFAQMIANYQLLPNHLLLVSALVLGWVELVCGLCLVFGILTRGASLFVLALMIVFLAAMGYNLQRGLDVACGCFSTDPNGPPLSPLTLLRDGVLLVVAVIVFSTSGLQKR